jgi:diacylglycerol O-acyltransferase / wax synthase
VFLRALDGAFLDLDTHDAPLHVGWTIRLEGRPPSLGGLRRHLAARLDRVPRLRQRLVATTLAGGERRFEDDPAFDIARHVMAVALPAPGGVGELRAAAGVLLSTPLDPARPLWRMCVVDGLAGGGWALVGQVHHVLVDGIAAVEVAALLLDADPDAPPDPPSRWRPRRTSPARAALDAARSRLAGAVGGFRGVGTEGASDAGDALRDLTRPAPRTSLDRSVGPARLVAFADARLDAVRQAGRARGATVNDVLLAASAVALGAALRRRGEGHEELKALVPVSVRDAPSELGNRLSFVVVGLPVAERDPAVALSRVVAQTTRAKSAGHAGPVAALAEVLALLPRRGRAWAARLALWLASFNVIVSNVPGPDMPLYLMGRRVTAIHPAVPVPDGHGLTIGALSYAGRIGVGLYADAVAVPDVVEIARDLESALDALRVSSEDPKIRLGSP